MTKDKDSYEYKYDYENRIIKITKDSTDIAEFSYDALGRRIEKKDLVDPNNTRRYYYNYNWQVLCDANDSDVFQNWYAYGNYIDEVLMTNWTNLSLVFTKFYAHDHLYSPVALLWSGESPVLERYEYDAYGKVKILNADFTDDADNKSDYVNPYYFTGRRLDELDNGNLDLMYYRNRYYDTHTGRFTTQDRLSFVDGMNLYEYVKSIPTNFSDPYGESRYPNSYPYPPVEPAPPLPDPGWYDVKILNYTYIECNQRLSSKCREGETKKIARCTRCEWKTPWYESLGWRKREKIEKYCCNVRYLHYECKCKKWKLDKWYPEEPATFYLIVKARYTLQRWFGWRWPPSLWR